MKFYSQLWNLCNSFIEFKFLIFRKNILTFCVEIYFLLLFFLLLFECWFLDWYNLLVIIIRKFITFLLEKLTLILRVLLRNERFWMLLDCLFGCKQFLLHKFYCILNACKSIIPAKTLWLLWSFLLFQWSLTWILRPCNIHEIIYSRLWLTILAKPFIFINNLWSIVT